jgi:hypothetical protein
MKSGKLTREKWASNKVAVGDKVKDTDGRIFKVLEVSELPDVSVATTRLEKV